MIEIFRLNFRVISSDINECTSIFSLIQNIGFRNTIYTNIPNILDSKNISFNIIFHLSILFILWIFNSIINFIIRHMIQISVDKTYITRLPIPKN